MIVLHLQTVIDRAGHVFAGSAARFDDMTAAFAAIEFDLALVDIDLADGRTGGMVAEWLLARGRPSLFLTGQEQLAADYAHLSLGTIPKPVSEESLCQALRALGKELRPPRT